MLSRLRAAAPVLAVTLAVLVSGCAGSGSSAKTSSASSGPESGFDGAPFPRDVGAADFTLTDQDGRQVSLGGYRGQVVMLTFLYSTCGDTCVLIAQQIRGALDELQAEHAPAPAVLIVSADPAADTPAHVARFLAGVSLAGRVRYLTGPPAQLRPIWRAYGVKPASVGSHEFDEYAPVLLIDPEGRKRVLFEAEELTPEALSHDVRELDGDPSDP